MAVQITNLSDSQIRVVVDAGATTITYDILKHYCTLYQPGEPILRFLWHQYELNVHQRTLDIDFNDVTVPVCVSAADLATQVQAFIDTIYPSSTGGYATVEDEGVALTQRTTMNFVGAGVTATDAGGKTVVTIPGASTSDASETVKGVVEEATQSELNAGTDTGATGAKLFATPSKLAVWIQQAALTIDAIWHFVSAKLRLFNAAKTFYIAFTTAATANRSQAFQDASGTIALTSDIPSVTPAALTTADDTNVTATLSGTPSTALLQSVLITLGWTGTLADGRIASAATWNGKTTLAAVNAQNLSVFAATTSAQLAGVINDETGSGVLVFSISPTLTAIILAAGTAAAGTAPINFTKTAAVLLTAAVAGAMEVDANGKAYYTHATNERGVIDAEQFMTLTAAYTLTSQTAAQKLFNTPTNGAVTLAGSTAYFFECVFSLTAMSSTSGNFGFALGGTATLTSVMWQSNASKSGSNTNGNAAVSATVNTGAANTTISGANTSTNGTAYIRGIVRINAGGTLIPQVSFTTVAGAVTPIVGIDSYFRIWAIGTNSVVSVGNFS